MNIKSVLENKSLVINSLFIGQSIKLKLSLNEFLVLAYFDNLVNKEFDIKQMVDILKMNDSDALMAFNQLLERKLLVIVAEKSRNGKIIEKINLEPFYALILEDFKTNNKEEEKKDVFSVFEKEFGRPLSSMEYEIINTWLDKSFTEELILGALKEAIYTGVTNLRYIDKILYEWQRKGLKNMQDVEKHLCNRTKKKENQESQELFDYNWLDEDN